MRAIVVVICLAIGCGGRGGGTPCRSDGECAIGQVCRDERCAEGCRSARDCPVDQPICDGNSCVACADSTDCDAGEVCAAGACRTSCDNDDACGAETCDEAQHVCVECTDGGHCELGAVCADQRCTPGCTGDRDCPADRPYCDPGAGAHGTCSECELDGQCASGQRCVERHCRSVCATDRECATNLCDPASHTCVECLAKPDCLAGEVCVAKVCELGCEESRDCPANEPVCDPDAGPFGTCYVCTRDTHCGAGERCVNHVCEGSAAPIPSFVMSPEIAWPGGQIGFDAAATTDPVYPPGELSVRWDWTADGSYDTPFSTNKIAFHAYTISGDYTVRMQVKNPAGVTRATSKAVQIIGMGGQGTSCDAPSDCYRDYLCVADSGGTYCAQSCASLICLESGTTCRDRLDVNQQAVRACVP